MPPAASPISVGLIRRSCAPGLNDITITPAVAITIAAVIGSVTGSPRNRSPKIATCIGSVLM